MSTPQILSAGWDPVVPADAGWTYVSFGVHTLQAGQTLTLPSSGQERALVPLAGTASAAADGQTWQFGGRRSVFDGLGWCLYLPFQTEVTVTAVTDLEIAVAEAPARRPSRLSRSPRTTWTSSCAAEATPHGRSAA